MVCSLEARLSELVFEFALCLLIQKKTHRLATIYLYLVCCTCEMPG